THRLHALAAAGMATSALRSPLPAGIARGWRNVGPAHQPMVFETGDLKIEVPGARLADEVVSMDAESVVLEVDGVRRRCEVRHVDDTWYVDSVLGASALREVARFAEPGHADRAGSLRAPLPGVVTNMFVTVGAVVIEGQAMAS